MDRGATPILGLGAATPVGRNAWASAAAVRAGVCGFAQHPFMVDTAGEPMRVALAPWLPIGLQGADRMAALLLPAMQEALAPLGAAAQALRLGVALALPPSRPGRQPELADALLHAIGEDLPDLRPRRMARLECGHAAGHLALANARSDLTAGALDALLLASVDSYLAPETLEWVEACDQLHGGGPLNNAWGFVPGEGAGALLLGSPELVHRLGLTPLGDVVSGGVGMESCRIKTDTVCIGQGLTQAFRGALAGLAPGEVVHDVFCDLNGEPYRADEFGFAALRTGKQFRAASDFVAPADCWGDVGAAGAALHALLAVAAWRKGYAKGPVAMAWGSSESGERGALLLRGAPAQRA